MDFSRLPRMEGNAKRERPVSAVTGPGAAAAVSKAAERANEAVRLVSSLEMSNRAPRAYSRVGSEECSSQWRL